MSLPKNLEILIVDNNKLDYLDTRGTKIKYLYCSINNINDLYIDSKYIEKINCSYNKLDYFSLAPYKSYKKLEDLNIAHNNLDMLSNATLDCMPNLKKLSVYSNPTVTISRLPPSLIKLYCSDNRLEELPKLPPNIDELYCSYNMLKNIPIIPYNCRRVHCNNNYILEVKTENPYTIVQAYNQQTSLFVISI